MKYYKIVNQLFLYSFTLFLFTVVSSCIEIGDSKAYYNFKEEDYDRILNFEENQIIKFQNNLGELREFKARNIYGINKKSTIGWIESLDNLEPPIPFPDSNSIYFDTQHSTFNVIEDGNATYSGFKYRYSRFPDDLYQAQKNSNTEYPSIFIGQIYFNKWNALDNTRIINIDFNATTTSMIINGTTYDKVYTFESGNPNERVCGFIIYDVSRIYYDLHSGIIGYDKVDGTQWRLIN